MCGRFELVCYPLVSGHGRPDSEWRGYIPESKIIYPDYSGDLSKPSSASAATATAPRNPNESSWFVQ